MAATTADGNKVDEVVGGDAVKNNKMITLKCSDGVEFEITHEAAAMSQTIKHMMEDNYVDNGVPLPNVSSTILVKVIEYCNNHVAASSYTDREKEDLKYFDAGFVQVDQATLFDMMIAANYLDIKGLLDLTCQTIA